MQIDRKGLKRQAREAMFLTRPRFWAVCLMYLLLTTGVDGLLHLFPSVQEPQPEALRFFSFFCSILYILYSLVIQFGFNLWSLWSWRKLNPGMGSLIQGFSITGRIILMELLIFLRVLGWIILLTVGVTVMIVFVPSTGSYVFGFALLYAAAFAIMLRYAMAPYLLADAPDDGAAAAVRRSVEMMRGRKWELFKLQFSFIGWYILQILLSGIVLAVLLIRSGVLYTPLTPDSLLTYQAVINGLSAFFLTNLISLPLAVWIIPYTSVAQAGFYDTVRQQEPVYDHEEMPPL